MISLGMSLTRYSRSVRYAVTGFLDEIRIRRMEKRKAIAQSLGISFGHLLVILLPLCYTCAQFLEKYLHGTWACGRVVQVHRKLPHANSARLTALQRLGA